MNYSKRTIANPLSAKEVQILEEMAKGCTYQQIADKYICSHHTIKIQVNKLLAMFDANNGTHAVVIAIQKGIIKI